MSIFFPAVFVAGMFLLLSFLSHVFDKNHWLKFALLLMTVIILSYLGFLIFNSSIDEIKQNLLMPQVEKYISDLHEIYFKKIVFFSLLSVFCSLLIFILVEYFKSENIKYDYRSQEILRLQSEINQLKEDKQSLQDYQENLLKENQKKLLDGQNIIKENQQLREDIAVYQQSHQEIGAIRRFLGDDIYDDHHYFLESKFQDLYQHLLFGNHMYLERSLLEYNQIAMNIALFKEKKYPNLLSKISLMKFDDAIQECQLLNINKQALTKQIFWLIFVLLHCRKELTDNDSLEQIQQFVYQMYDVGAQKSAWLSLQKTEPKVILRIQKGVAYVL